VELDVEEFVLLLVPEDVELCVELFVLEVVPEFVELWVPLVVPLLVPDCVPEVVELPVTVESKYSTLFVYGSSLDTAPSFDSDVVDSPFPSE
jgi:hypothetical protein